MKTKKEKQEIIGGVAELLKGCSGVAVSGYQGLTMKTMSELRVKIKPFGAKLMVVKNTLSAIAAKGTSYENTLSDLKGCNALVFLGEDASAALKVLFAFEKDNAAFKMQKGKIDDMALDAISLKAYSELPTKNEMRAMFLGLLQSSASTFVGLLDAPARTFVGVVKAYEDKLGGQQAA